MTGNPDGKSLAPAREAGLAAATPAMRHRPAAVGVTLPGEIDITNDGQAHGTLARVRWTNVRNPELGIWQGHGALRTAVMTDRRGLALGGDIDEETHPALVEALNHIPRDNDRLHVDLSAVTYCDLAGLRAIIQLADVDVPLILHGVSRTLRTVMEILGWDQEPGLVISKRQHSMRMRYRLS
jgi:anti-anti-sigma regulatory factor